MDKRVITAIICSLITLMHKVNSRECLDPNDDDTFVKAVNESDFAIIGHFMVNKDRNSPVLNVSVDHMHILPREFFGSPCWCCSREDYVLEYHLRASDTSHERGCYVTNTKAFEGNRQDQIFFIKASENYTLIEPVAVPMAYNTSYYNRIRKLSAGRGIIEKPVITVSNALMKNVDHEEQYDVIEGSSFDLQCTHKSECETRRFLHWKKNSVGLPENKNSMRYTHNRIGSNNDVVIFRIFGITDAIPELDSGNYSCFVKSHFGSSSWDTVYINVLPMRRPQWQTKENFLKNMTLKKRGNIALQCPATGTPDPEIRWYKDGELLSNSDEVDKSHRSINGSILTFHILKMNDSGFYKCEASNQKGIISTEGELTITDPSTEGELTITDPEVATNLSIIITGVILSSVLILVCIILCVKVHKDRRRAYFIRLEEQRAFEEGNPESLNPDLTLADQVDLLPYDVKYEVSRDSIVLDKLLGTGAFGRVYRATASNVVPGQPQATVAVKMMKSRTDNSQLKALRSEVKIMVHIGRHINIVNLLGACSKNLASKGELLMLVEYCKHGSILDYLRRHRKDFIDQISEYDYEIRMGQRHGSYSGNKRSQLVNHSYDKFRPTCTSKQSTDDSLPNDFLQEKTSTSSESDVSESSRLNTASNSEAAHIVTDMTTVTYEMNAETSDGLLRSSAHATVPVTICSRDLLCWAFQIAKGMEYLAFKKVLHGDLAARNILLTEGNIVKISDFGLAKDIYKDANYMKKSKTLLPWKWLAVECLREGVYSTQSDIWSFGVVLWEIFSLGQSPYPGVHYDNTYVTKLEEGMRMERPEYASHDLYCIMLKCWGKEPMERPSFSSLEVALSMMLDEGEKQHYLELNTPYQEENTASTYVNYLQSPDYAAKLQDRCSILFQDRNAISFKPNSHDLAMSLSQQSAARPLIFQLNDVLKNSDASKNEATADSYVPMHSPVEGTVFTFDKEVVNYITKNNINSTESE